MKIRHLCFLFMLNANKTFYHVSFKTHVKTNLRMSCSNPLLKMLFCNIGCVRLFLSRNKNTHKSLQVHFLGQNIFSVYLLIRSSELALIELQMHLLIKTLSVGYLNEALLRPRFNKSLNIQISFLVGYFKKRNAFLVYTICYTWNCSL